MADEKVKVTIRLPRTLVQRAKHHAMLRGEDLQDMVAAALDRHLKKLPPAPPTFAPGEAKQMLTEMLKTISPASAKQLTGGIAALAKRVRKSQTKKGNKA